MQVPTGENYAWYINECYRRMYKAFERDRHLIPANRLHDVRYEDLIADPVGRLRQIYESLHLGEFDSVQTSIQQWVESEHKGYRTSHHQKSSEQDELIRNTWSDYMKAYGYK